MYVDLVLYTEPRRPLINPKFDLFAWLNLERAEVLFPARVVETVQIMLPEKCKHMDRPSPDMWDFITWQAEEKGYAVVQSIDTDWIYWSVLANKYTLLNMVRLFT